MMRRTKRSKNEFVAPEEEGCVGCLMKLFVCVERQGRVNDQSLKRRYMNF
jgi:hypothetical protein